MYTYVKKITIALLATSCLLGLSACGNMPTHGAPSMVDYAYVPPSDNATVFTPYNLESY